MKKLNQLLALLFITWTMVQNTFAEDIYMYPLKNNMAGNELPRDIYREVETAINNHGMVLVHDKEHSKWIIKGEIYRVGTTLSLTLRKFRPSGQLDKATSVNLPIQSSERPETMNNIITDLFPDTALPQQQSTASTGYQRENTVGNVDSSQIRKMTTRIQSKNGTYLGFGPGATTNQSNKDLTYHFLAGKYYDINPNFTLLLNTDWLANKNTFWGSAAIGVQYFITDADISPFMGGEFGFGHTNSKETKGVTGFEGGAQIGVKFFRTSTTQLVVAGQYNTIFRDNGKGLPQFYGLAVSLHY